MGDAAGRREAPGPSPRAGGPPATAVGGRPGHDGPPGHDDRQQHDSWPGKGASGGARMLMGLQRAAGNAAVARVVQRKTGGSALPDSALGARRALGPAAPDVRVHRGPVGRPEALAVTDGLDITLAPHAPAADSPAGGALLAHEAAHVLQHVGDGPELSTAAAEERADQAMLAAVSGKDIPAVGRAAGPHYFEARWHQATLTNAMDQAGFSDEEQQAAYFANWCRDVSQFMVPAAASFLGTQNIMLLLNVMSQLKFGREVTPAELGRYSRREHIDAPAGTTNLDQLGAAEELGALATPEERAQLGAKQHLQGRGDLPVEGGPEHLDSPVTPKDLSSRSIEELMQVDASGVPAYIDRSKGYIKEQAGAALDAGRTPDGLAHLGNFSHTVQDLFAHSNWVETAVGKLIQDGTVTLDLSATGPEGEAARDLQERELAGRPPVETYAGEVQGEASAARPILTTGTFSGSFGEPGHDTAISLRHEAKNVLEEHNPFIPGQADGKWWDLGIELLERAEISAEEGTLGPIFTEHVEQLLTITGVGDAVTSAASGVAEEAAGIPILSDVAAWGARQVEGGVEAAADAWKSGLRTATEAAVNGVLSSVSLADIARFVKDGTGAIKGAWQGLKDAVSELPDRIRNLIMPKLLAAERKFKEKMRALGEAAWAKAVGALMAGLGEGEPMVQERESNTERKLERMLAQIDELRTTLFAKIDEVAPDAEGQAIKARLSEMPLDEVLPYLASGQFALLLGQLDEAKAEELRTAAREYGTTSERVGQLQNLPEWARPGPSHSQLAKDHATSPFFGAAFTMANLADGTLVNALQQAWAAMGFTERAAGLEGDMGDLVDEDEGGPADPAVRRAEERTGESDIERDRRTKFLETRAAGQRVLALGHGEVRLPSQALGAAADALWGVQLAQPVLGPVLRTLISLLRRTAPGAQIIAEAERVRGWLDTDGDEVVEDAGDAAAAGIAAAYSTVRATIVEVIALVQSSLTPACEPGETEAEHNTHAGMHAPGESPERHAQHAGVCEPGETAPQHTQHAQAACPGETMAEHARHAGSPCPGETPAQHIANAGPVHDGETPEEHAQHSGHTPAHYHEQIARLDELRGKGRAVPVEGRALSPEEIRDRDMDIDEITEPEERLMAEIERIFGHPYDSNWWVPTLSGWANENKGVLAQYILARNSGQLESHAH